jgi:LmbE family N-acetylglucosaminyl deacetylase
VTTQALAGRGRRGAEQRGSLVVVSPHLDDGVLSCGRLLASRPGAVLVTVFAGRPEPPLPLSTWDAASGFADGDDVVACRQQEDHRACAALGADSVWLPFLDAQYSTSDTPHEELVDAIGATLDTYEPAIVAIPLGLFHSDHRCASDAAFEAASERREMRTILYADWPYSHIDGAIPGRVSELRSRGVRLTPTGCAGHGSDECADAKREAIGCYRSQLRAFATNRLADPLSSVDSERYWDLRWT